MWLPQKTVPLKTKQNTLSMHTSHLITQRRCHLHLRMVYELAENKTVDCQWGLTTTVVLQTHAKSDRGFWRMRACFLVVFLEALSRPPPKNSTTRFTQFSPWQPQSAPFETSPKEWWVPRWHSQSGKENQKGTKDTGQKQDEYSSSITHNPPPRLEQNLSIYCCLPF